MYSGNAYCCDKKVSVGRCLQFFYTGLVAALATPWILVSFSQVCDAHPWKVKWSSPPAHLAWYSPPVIGHVPAPCLALACYCAKAWDAMCR